MVEKGLDDLLHGFQIHGRRGHGLEPQRIAEEALHLPPPAVNELGWSAGDASPCWRSPATRAVPFPPERHDEIAAGELDDYHAGMERQTAGGQMLGHKGDRETAHRVGGTGNLAAR